MALIIKSIYEYEIKYNQFLPAREGMSTFASA